MRYNYGEQPDAPPRAPAEVPARCLDDIVDNLYDVILDIRYAIEDEELPRGDVLHFGARRLRELANELESAEY